MEHLHHFGLSEDPFRNEPRLRDFFETVWTRDALARLERGLRQNRGLVVLTGEVGSGKTMLVRRLLESLEEEVFDASMLVVLSGGADACWILTRFAKLLGIEEPEPERDALLAQVYEQLAIIREDGRHAVLIIDDAHLLTSGDTLSEICGLLKLEYEDRRLFSLVLVGDDGLDAAMAVDAELAHRVEVKVRMEPLDLEGVAAYLVHRIQQAGGAPSILEAEAISALQRLGRGLPGWMNTLADNAIFEAFLCGRQQVSRVDIECVHRALGWEQPAEAPAAQPAQAPAAQPAQAPAAQPAEVPAAQQPAEVPAAQLAEAPAAQPAQAPAAQLAEAPAAQLAEAPAAQLAEAPAAQLAEVTAPQPVRAAEAELEILDPLDSELGKLDSEFGELDSELEAVFEIATSEPGSSGSLPPPTQLAFDGPPKEDEPEDLLIELLED